MIPQVCLYSYTVKSRQRRELEKMDFFDKINFFEIANNNIENQNLM